MSRLFAWIPSLVFLTLPAVVASAGQVDYWVWHRQSPLTDAEWAALKAQRVTTLYWNVGEMENRDGTWRWKAPVRPLPSAAVGFRLVPVVRLTSERKDPFAATSLDALRTALKLQAGESGALQLDYDCPDRLLGKYAAALHGIRESVPHLSITALAEWPRLPDFAKLTAQVEAIVPMFYDLQRDPTGVSPSAPPPPLLDPQQIETALRLWAACPIPWRAGLPTFARLTVFDRTGLSRGQIPNWTWEDFCFHKSLHTLGPAVLGVTLLRADADTRVAATPVGKDEIVASRFTDRAALAKAVSLAHQAGAAGAVLFRLPDGSDPSGPSLADLMELDGAEQPRVLLRRGTDDQLELVNESSRDLGPRLSGENGDRDRGYALEVDAPAAMFREALAGEFWRVTAHARPDARDRAAVAVPLATRLTFWFSQLRAGAHVRTGLLQLAPGASFENVRYRIVGCDDLAEWKQIQLTDSSTVAH